MGNSEPQSAGDEKDEATTPIKYDPEDAFEEFMRTANPRVEVHSLQYRESRRVWMAANWSLFVFLSRELPTLGDDAAEAELQVMEKELRDYFDRLSGDKD